MVLLIYNSLSRKKEEFKPINPGHVGMYVCGPTVYQHVHLGNIRTFITFDVVYRYLQHLGYKVRYVRNITDVGHMVNDADSGDDKIAKQAKLEQLEPMEIVQKYQNGFHDVCKLFNILPPSIEPSAIGHIMEQIEMVQAILDNGLAYEVNGSVYFDVKKYLEKHEYGTLSGRNVEELQAGSRELDAQDEKRFFADFSIWKAADETYPMRWKSPWGYGVPGWHMECSVMSTKYLGEQFDIHGGGMDLKFPHHECEIAQSIGSGGKSPVNYWMHGNMLTVNGTKMSKSLGNSFLPTELIAGDHELLDKPYPAIVARFFMLQTHYSSTLDFSNDALQASEKGLKRLLAAVKLAKGLKASTESSVSETVEELNVACAQHMNDDFNTPQTIARLFDLSSLVNKVNDGAEKANTADIEAINTCFKNYLFDVMGLWEEDEASNDLIDPVMELVIDIRTKARADKDWGLSDKIRDQLATAGIQIKDNKEGSSWERS